MPALLEARTLTVSIQAPPSRVYEFVADARNLPRWSFFQSVAKKGDSWVLDAPDGPVELRFVERNSLGVLDHYVTPPSGVEIYVPMRVIPNGEGSQVLFTLFRAKEMSAGGFDADAKQVERDLTNLKAVLEGS